MKLFCNACQTVFFVEPAEGTTETPCSACGASVPVPETRVAPGVVIGDFLIERSLGHGGMGEVYIARQISLDRQVALKVLQERFTDDKEHIEGLFREARAAAKITHPHIVQAYAVGEEDGVYYFAMELIRGETFKQILKRDSILDFKLAAKVICEVAGALDVAWKEQKLVHQDIKPDNIMLDSNGFAKLADLGLARSASNNDAETDNADEVMGTPQYISPEQLTGVPTDVRSDIYSLGATFFQFVTGRFPYVADTAEEITRMHVAGDLTPPKEFNPDLPDALNAIIIKMMARNIEERYQLPGELVTDLQAFLNASKDGKTALKRPGLTPGAKTLPGIKKPGMPALGKPGLPGAKPALSKPGVPALGKPGLPGAKPALGKPGVPALGKPGLNKPGTPAEKAGPGQQIPPTVQETEPAQEAVPAAVPVQEEIPQAVPVQEEIPQAVPAEAVPAQEEIPQAVPVEAVPAEEEKKQDNDGITLAPETRKRQKQEAAQEKENAVPGEDDGKKKTRRKKENSGEKKKLPGFVKVIFHLLLLVLLLGILAAVFCFAAKKDKLPAKLKPWGEKALAWTGLKSDAQNSEAGKTETAEKTVPAKEVPKEPEKPKTRPEYLAALENLQSEFRNTAPDQRGKLLSKADELFQKLGPHQTPEELDALIRTWALYSTADENLRFSKQREAALAKYEKAASLRREAKEKEAERLQREKEEEERRKQELAQQNAEFDRMQKKRQAEINQRFAKLKRDLDTLNINLVKALVSSAESGNDSAYETAMREAKNYIIPTVCDTIAERAIISFFENFKRQAPSALAAYKTFINNCKQIKAHTSMVIPVSGRNTLVDLLSISPDGTIAYRTVSDQHGTWKPDSAKERRRLENYLSRSTNLAGGAFYYNLMTRNFEPIVAKYSPHPFWTMFMKQYRSLAGK